MSSKKCLTRVSSKSVLGECQARASHKSVKSECHARVSYQSVAQWCQARVSYKSVTSVCQVNVFNRWVRWKLWQISIKSLFLNIRVGIRVRGLHLVFCMSFPKAKFVELSLGWLQSRTSNGPPFPRWKKGVTASAAARTGGRRGGTTRHKSTIFGTGFVRCFWNNPTILKCDVH